jgi:hypothetical protein
MRAPILGAFRHARNLCKERYGRTAVASRVAAQVPYEYVSIIRVRRLNRPPTYVHTQEVVLMYGVSTMEKI